MQLGERRLQVTRGYIDCALMREGLDYTQTKTVFKQTRGKDSLLTAKESCGAPARLTLEEELRLIDQAHAQGGHIGLMMQVLLEISARVSVFVALRVVDVSLAERVIVIGADKGGKRREVPMRPVPITLAALAGRSELYRSRREYRRTPRAGRVRRYRSSEACRVPCRISPRSGLP